MSLFALIDCNNFFASCERVFNPKLRHKPLVILSNNDGCIVARSAEAKKIGIPMGAPLHEYRDLCHKHHVQILSSNYELYGDMSSRVLSVIRETCPKTEVYSIDEAFVDWAGMMPHMALKICHDLHHRIHKWTGIPVTIGLAPTKTLAKASCLMAKENLSGVNAIFSDHDRCHTLKSLALDDIWGIGRQSAVKLKSKGLVTAFDLTQQDDYFIRKNLTVTGLRLVKELQGQSCLTLEEQSPHKSMMSTRSFGKNVTDKNDFLEALASHSAHLACRLRKENLTTSYIRIFVRFRHPHESEVQSHHSDWLTLSLATQNSFELIKGAQKLGQQLYKKGLFYKKVGVLIGHLLPANALQQTLFAMPDEQSLSKNHKLMTTLDEINKKMGHQKIFIGAEGIQKSWRSLCQSSSPRYTTRLDELVKCN